MDKEWVFLFVGAGLAAVGFIVRELYFKVNSKEIAVLQTQIEELRTRVRALELSEVANLAQYNAQVGKLNAEIHGIYEKMLEKLLALKNEK